MAKVEQPMFIFPKKRNGKKQSPISSHVDHIISVQGAAEDLPTKYKNGLSPVTEHVVNGIIHSTMEGLKSNMKINLPIITDENDEDVSDGNETDIQEKPPIEKNGYQALATIHNSREIIDLSPIYENSSDAYSSHGDLRETTENDVQRGFKMLNSDVIESCSATPNSMSQTHSETSLEIAPLTDSLKNSAKRKKKVNIVPGVHYDNTDTEITALRVESEDSISQECSLTDNSRDAYLTMTGTIKRGKKKGQNVDVKLNISREELEIIEAAIVADEYNKMDISKCSIYNGPHIFVFTLLCTPFVACISALYSFYMGTMAWYNIFTHVTENFNCMRKVFLAPIVILTFPFLIVIFTVGLGVYAGIVQLTFSGATWWKDVCDFEKGFYGWLCNSLGMSQCSPYEVVILMDVKPA